MSHTVELDAKTYQSARRLMSCAELQTIRLTRCKVSIDVEAQPSEENQVSLRLKAKANGRKVSNSQMEITFDFSLVGSSEIQSVKAIDIALRLVGVYSIPPTLDVVPTEIRAFAMSNGMLNAWPYWREFIQSTSVRAGLPPLTVPLFRIQHIRPEQTI